VTLDVFACFELCEVDTPVLLAVKSFDNAVAWRDADLLNRYYVCFALDAEPEVAPARDLFEWAKRQQEQSK
jgi:hypothetical protein